LHDLKSQPKLADRLAIKSEGRIIFLGLSEIDWVEAADNYVKVHVGKQTHMLRQTMAVLETKLPGDRFLRISRSTIVNMEQIKELHPMFHGDYVVVLRNGVRLTWDRVRQTNVLLYPEGVLVPNPTAAAVLRLCTGESTVDEITTSLGARYTGVCRQDVEAVLTRLADRRVVEWT